MASKSKIITLSILSVVGLGLCTGGVLSAWAVTDNAQAFTMGVYLDKSLAEGHYLYWNGSDVGVLLNKDDLGGNKYKYSIDISNTMVGNKTFLIKDHNDNVIVDQSSALTIDLVGTYTLTTKDVGYDLTYPLYFTNPGFAACNAYFFDSADGSRKDTWPGNSMVFDRKNAYNEDVYRIDVDAKNYAMNSSMVIFNNNNSGKQTVDIPLSGTTAGVTGYYAGGSSTVTLETSGTTWAEANAIIVAYLWKEGDGSVTNKWEKLTKDGTKFSGSVQYSSDYNSVIFIRYNPSEAPSAVKNNTSGTGWPGDSGIWGRIDKNEDIDAKRTVYYSLSDYNNASQNNVYRATSYNIND